jgi:hypothetical protein
LLHEEKDLLLIWLHLLYVVIKTTELPRERGLESEEPEQLLRVLCVTGCPFLDVVSKLLVPIIVLLFVKFHLVFKSL